METKLKDNKRIVREYIENVFNSGNTEHIAEYISDDYVEIFQNETYKLGIEGAIKHVVGVWETYPDIVLKIENQIAEGDWVVTCYTMTGTHSGNWMGMKPTFKKLVITGVDVDRLINGKIVEHGGAANMLHPFLEIGAINIISE